MKKFLKLLFKEKNKILTIFIIFYKSNWLILRIDEYHLLNDIFNINLLKNCMNLEFSNLFLEKSVMLLKSKYEIHILKGI